MKSILLFMILTAPVINAHAEPTCKQQVTHLKESLKNLETIITSCQKDFHSTCSTAIAVNREAILGSLDYAMQICPARWAKELKKAKESIK